MTKFEKFLFAIMTLICVLIIITLITGNVQVIIVVNEHIESKVKEMDWQKIYQVAKYIVH